MLSQFRGSGKRIVAIVKPDLAPLIRILGIEDVVEVYNEAEVLEVFKRIIMSENVGIILIQKRLVEGAPSDVLEDVHSRLYPVLITLPDSVEDLKKNPIEVYRDLVRRFIGFEVHL
ncbi:MAG: V-type ATP synthase subunit F [Desulfurococcaceae archaeon]